MQQARRLPASIQAASATTASQPRSSGLARRGLPAARCLCTQALGRAQPGPGLLQLLQSRQGPGLLRQLQRCQGLGKLLKVPDYVPRLLAPGGEAVGCGPLAVHVRRLQARLQFSRRAGKEAAGVLSGQRRGGAGSPCLRMGSDCAPVPLYCPRGAWPGVLPGATPLPGREAQRLEGWGPGALAPCPPVHGAWFGAWGMRLPCQGAAGAPQRTAARHSAISCLQCPLDVPGVGGHHHDLQQRGRRAGWKPPS